MEIVKSPVNLKSKFPNKSSSKIITNIAFCVEQRYAKIEFKVPVIVMLSLFGLSGKKMMFRE